MMLKKLRASTKSSKNLVTINPPRLATTQSNAADNDAKSHTPAFTREKSHDYEVFLENARNEAKLKEKEMLKAAKEAERRRKEFNMDPWASRW